MDVLVDEMRYEEIHELESVSHLILSVCFWTPPPQLCSLRKVLVCSCFFQLAGYFGDGRGRMICILNRFSVSLCVRFSITIAEFNTLLKPQLLSPSKTIFCQHRWVNRAFPLEVSLSQHSKSFLFVCAEHRYYMTIKLGEKPCLICDMQRSLKPIYHTIIYLQ